VAKVLVLDSSPDFLSRVSGWLSERGHRPVTVESPVVLVSLIRRERPDIVVVDLEHPSMRGERIAAAVRDFADCPVVLSSRVRGRDVAMLCVESGAAGHVLKSDDGNAYMRSLEAHLPRRSLIPGELMPRIKGR